MPDPDVTRARILDAASRLFARDGYGTTTIRQIGAEVGLTSAALYYHFPSKHDCLEALVAPYLDALDEVLDRHPMTDDPDAVGRRRLLSDYLAVLTRSPELTRLIDRDPAVATDPAIGARLDGAITGLLARLQGDARDDHATLRATAALGALRRPVLRGDLDVEAMADELVDVVLRVFDA